MLRQFIRAFAPTYGFLRMGISIPYPHLTPYVNLLIGSINSALQVGKCYVILLLSVFVVGACSSQGVLEPPLKSTLTEIQMLSGTGSDDAVEWDFYCNKGRNCGKWSKIPVPSNWEQQGFGHYDYGYSAKKHNEQGIYRRHFSLPENWKNRSVELVFDGVMTDATAFVNQKQVGVKHQGGFYRFSYDITPFLKFGEANEIKVVVDKP